MATNNESEAAKCGTPHETSKTPVTIDLGMHLPPVEDGPVRHIEKASLIEEVTSLTMSASPTYVRNTWVRGQREDLE